MHVTKTEIGCIIQIHLTENRNRCRAVVNTAVNLQVPYNAGQILTISAY